MKIKRFLTIFLILTFIVYMLPVFEVKTEAETLLQNNSVNLSKVNNSKYKLKDSNLVYMGFSSIVYSTDLSKVKSIVSLGEFYKGLVGSLKSERAEETIWCRYKNYFKNASLPKEAYGSDGKIPLWKDFYDVTIKDWKYYKSFSKNSFFGAAFIDEKSKKIIIAYRGTQGKKDSGDLLTDVNLAKGTLDYQFDSALSFYNEIKNSTKNKKSGISGYSIDKVTGHSLGGALANYVSICTGQAAVTFNAPGITYQTFIKFAKNKISTEFKGIDSFNFIDHSNRHDIIGLSGETWNDFLKTWVESVDRKTVIHNCFGHRNIDCGTQMWAHEMESMLTLKNMEFCFTEALNDKKPTGYTANVNTPYMNGGYVFLGTSKNDIFKFNSIFNFYAKIYNVLYKEVPNAPVNIFCGDGDDEINSKEFGTHQLYIDGGKGKDVYKYTLKTKISTPDYIKDSDCQGKLVFDKTVKKSDVVIKKNPNFITVNVKGKDVINIDKKNYINTIEFVNDKFININEYVQNENSISKNNKTRFDYNDFVIKDIELNKIKEENITSFLGKPTKIEKETGGVFLTSTYYYSNSSFLFLGGSFLQEVKLYDNKIKGPRDTYVGQNIYTVISRYKCNSDKVDKNIRVLYSDVSNDYEFCGKVYYENGKIKTVVYLTGYKDWGITYHVKDDKVTEISLFRML